MHRSDGMEMHVGLPPAVMADVFPFHIIVDRDLRVTQVGPALARVMPALVPGEALDRHFRIQRPPVAAAYDAIAAHPRAVFLLASLEGPVRLKGQMLALEDGPRLAFLCSPAVTDLGSVAALGLSLGDFAVHDPIVDFLFLLQSNQTTLDDLKRVTETLKRERSELREARTRLQQLLAATPTVIYACRADGDRSLTFISENAARQFNEGAGPIDPQLMTERVHPEDRARLEAAYGRARTDGRSLVVYRLRGGDGKYRWRHDSLQPVTDATGQVVEFVGASQDVHDLMEIERALTESDSRGHAILDTALDCVIATDRHAQIIEFNLAAERTFGYARADVVGRDAIDLLVPETRAAEFREQIRADARNNTETFLGQRREITARAADGHEFPAELAVTRVEQQDGPIFVAYVRDITDRRQAEEALRESERNYRQVVDTVKEVIFRTDAQGNWTLLNPAWTEITGFPVAESLGRLFLDYVHPDDRERNTAAFQPLIEGRKEYCRHEIRYLTADGSFRWIEVYARLTHDAAGRTTGTSGTLNDVTERRLAGDRITASEARTRAIVDTAPEGVLTFDEKGIILLANAAAGRILGFWPDELTGRNARELLPAFGDLVADSAPTGDEVGNELEAIRADGIRVPVSLALSCATVAGERMMTGILRDLTGARRAQEELRRARDVAESANRAKSEFLALMSHEIRTPLHAILGMTELALATGLTSEQRDFLQTVQSSSDALLYLINDLLDFSKIEAGQMDIERVGFDPWDIIEGVAETVGVKAAAKDLELVCAIDPALPTRLIGDPNRLRQVLFNLAGNAVKFTEHGEVRLKVESDQLAGREATRLRVTVADTGIGIAQEDQPHIFERFYQARASTTHRVGGTGLGLAITRSLVDLMGGHIGFESHEGQGTSFRVELALDTAASQDTRLDASERGQHRLLVVDDSRTSRESLVRQLAFHGYPVDAVADAAEALDRLKSHEYAAAIIDQAMPGRSGLELIRQLRAEPSLAALPVMLLSGTPIPGLAGGPLAFESLVKPTRLRRLLGALDGALGVHTTARPIITLTQSPAPEAPSVPTRVLVAEDHPANQVLARRILEGVGCVVDIVDDGRAAVEAAEHRRYDLILMDLQMPVLDGAEAALAIREFEQRSGEPPVPIVAVTAHAVEGFREKCLQAGMDDYVAKPVSRKRLLEVVERWADRRPAILVADDSPDSQRLIVHYLRDMDQFRVIAVRNGQQALHQFDRQPVALVLLDMQMPVLDGYATAAAIRLRPGGARVPIFALSGRDGLAERHRSSAAGCDRHLVKPVRRATLVDAIYEVLSHHPGTAPPAAGAAGATAPSSPAPAEPDQFDTITLDPDIADLVPGYIDARRGEIGELRAGLREKAFARVGHIAHNLKGTGAGYGLVEVTRLGFELELAAREGDLPRATVLVDHLDAFLTSAAEALTPSERPAHATARPDGEARLDPNTAPTPESESADTAASAYAEFNLPHLRAVGDPATAEGRELLAEVFGVYFDDAAKSLRDLRDMAVRGETDAVRRRAHQQKGASSMIGADGVAAAFYRIELDAGTGELPAASALDELERRMGELKREADQIMAEGTR